MGMRTRVGALGLAMAVMAVLGCSSASPSAGEASTDGEGSLIPVTVGTIPVNTAIPLHVGLTEGFFEDEGLDVTTQQSSNFQASLASVLNGEYDFGLAANVPLMVSASKGAPIQVVAQTVVVDDQIPDMVVTKADADIASPRDLEHRTVAVVALSTPQEIGVREAVKRDGGNPELVEFVEFPSAQMIEAVELGTVDAAAATVPWVTLAEEAGLTSVFSYVDGVYPEGSIWAGFFANERLITESPDTVAAFTRAMNRATEFSRDNPDAARSSLLVFTDMDQATVDSLEVGTFSPELNLEANTALYEILRSYGLFEGELDLEHFFNE